MNEDYAINLFGEEVVLESDDFLSEPKKAWNEGFNIFSLTDAIASKDKRSAWVLYQKALASGMVAEEIFWKITWITKTLLLASKTKDYTETDMKEFPYRKAKENLKHWKAGELEKFSEDLVIGFHKARRGEGEIGTLIETMLLSL